MMDIKTFVCNPYEENCFIINKKASKKAIIIDPGCTSGEEQDRVNSYLAVNKLEPEAILLTHAHRDHIHGVRDLQEKYGIAVYMHPLEEPELHFESRPVGDGEELELADMKTEVIFTPGHTPGGADRIPGAAHRGTIRSFSFTEIETEWIEPDRRADAAPRAR